MEEEGVTEKEVLEKQIYLESWEFVGRFIVQRYILEKIIASNVSRLVHRDPFIMHAQTAEGVSPTEERQFGKQFTDRKK